MTGRRGTGDQAVHLAECKILLIIVSFLDKQKDKAQLTTTSDSENDGLPATLAQFNFTVNLHNGQLSGKRSHEADKVQGGSVVPSTHACPIQEPTSRKVTGLAIGKNDAKVVTLEVSVTHSAQIDAPPSSPWFK